MPARNSSAQAGEAKAPARRQCGAAVRPGVEERGGG